MSRIDSYREEFDRKGPDESYEETISRLKRERDGWKTRAEKAETKLEAIDNSVNVAGTKQFYRIKQLEEALRAIRFARSNTVLTDYAAREVMDSIAEKALGEGES